MEPQNQGTMACLHVVAFFFFKQNKFFFLHTCFKIRYSAENRKVLPGFLQLHNKSIIK